MKKYLAIAGAGLMMIGTAGLAAAATVDVGGEVRIRYENRTNLEFNDTLNNDEHGTHQRTRVNVNAKVNDDISAVVQLQNIRTWGSTSTTDNGSTDPNRTDTHQAYIQVNKVFGTPLSVRLGRQELSYGDQRLIGNLNWADSARAFDAAKIMYKSADLDIDVWAAKTRESSFPASTSSAIVTSTAGSGSDNDQNFYGIWATYKGIKDNTIDAYLLLLQDNGPATGSTGTSINGIQYNNNSYFSQGGTTIYNAGLRIKGATSGLDYSAEFNHQFGDSVDGKNISADGFAAVIGYTIPGDYALRISGEYVHADGDNSPTNGDVKTFNQLFPTGHMHLGMADLVGFQNVNAYRLGASVKPTKELFLSLDWWNFNLDEKNDAWYRANGSQALAAPASGNVTKEEIGDELDVLARYKYADNLTLEAGYSYFSPGNLIKDSTRGIAAFGGKDDEQHFAYGMVTLTF